MAENTTPTQTKRSTKAAEMMAKISEINGQHNFRKAVGAEIEAGLNLATDLIGDDLAPLKVIKRIDDHTQCTVWINGTPIVGVHFMIPLTESGIKALLAGHFHPGNPNLSHCAKPEEKYAGIYVGAYAGATRDVRKNIMQGAAAIRVICFGSLPCFARAATDDGARSMESLGFRPVEGNQDDLWMQEALTPVKMDAA